MLAALGRKLQHAAALLAGLLLLLLIWVALAPVPAVEEAPGPSQPERTAVAQRSPLARATASPAATLTPLPTAGPARIRYADDRQVVASVRRGPVTFELRVASDMVYVGEIMTAELRLRNNGDRVYELVRWPGTMFKHAYGRFASSWVHLAESLKIDDVSNQTILQRGGVISHSVRLYVPPESARANIFPQLWGTVALRPRGSSSGAIFGVDVGPIPLRVAARETRHLVVGLDVDEQGWRVRVEQPPASQAGPYWGALALVMRTARGNEFLLHRRLEERTDGQWSGAIESGDDRWLVAVIGALVSAPGYGATVVTPTLAADTEHVLPGSALSFSTLQEAERELDVSLSRPAVLPPGAALSEISAITHTQRLDGALIEVDQVYTLADSGSLIFTESFYMTSASSPEPSLLTPLEGQTVTFGSAQGRLARSLGEWQLSWKEESRRLRLRAPVASLSREDLLAIAAEVR